MDKMYRALEKVGEYFVNALGLEIYAQGHSNTDKLIESIDYKITKTSVGYNLDVMMMGYGIILNNGVKPGRVPFSGKRGGSGKTSQYIEALMDWIEQKGLESGDKEIKAFAFAIAHTHKKHGISSPASVRFSGTGKRTGFIETVLEESEEMVRESILDAAEESISVFLDNLILKANKELN